jgi:hypothetical protein
MKRTFLVQLLAIGSPVLLSGQTAVQTGQTPDYSISARGSNTRVWQQVVTMTNAFNGSVVHRTNSFTEISPGVCHFVSGQWVDSNDQIGITPTGAQATNAQHHVKFLGNINSGGTNGAVTIVTPEGKRLATTILGLSYWDTASGSNVFIAELTDSVGQILSSGNEAVYTNAFTGVQADVYYQNRISQLEQLIVLRQQLPDPAQWNMDPATTMFQVITAFADAPTPAIAPVATAAGMDEHLDFGVMHMVQGYAFALDSADNRIPVTKSWLVLDGQTCLVEQVPFTLIEAALRELGLPQASNSGRRGAASESLLASITRLRANTARSMAKVRKSPFLRAERPPVASKGFAMDYTLVVSATNLLFAPDTTYLVANGVTATLSGSNVFCGGTVIKFGTNSAIDIVPSSGTPTATFLGAPYQPITFTAVDDSSWGQKITTNSPTGYYANPALYFSGLSQAQTLNYVRFAYANAALGSAGVNATVSHAQFVNCQTGVSPTGCTIKLRNALFCNTVTNVACQSAGMASAENVTFADSKYFVTSGDTNSSLFATNCIFASVTNLSAGGPTLTGDYNAFYQTTSFGYDLAPPVSTWPFQAVGAGYYYLADGSPYRNAGTTGIFSNLLTAIAGKTTYPPLLYTNSLFVNTTLAPQAQRDYDTPDLGFHYDPMDYFIGCTVSNATLTLTNGVVVAYYNNGGIWLQNDSSLVSFGGPTQRNWLAHYSMIQEEPVDLAPPGTTHVNAMPFNTYHTVTPSQDPSITLRFTSIAAPDSANYILYTDNANWETANLLVQDCEIWACGASFSLENGTGLITLQNNLFDHTSMGVFSSAQLSGHNNLFRAPASYDELFLDYFGMGSFTNCDNAFDGCQATLTGSCSNNAYLNGGTNSILSSGDIYTNLTWIAGPLGAFYQATNSPLINAGSRTADVSGLFHYTVMTNLVNSLEIKETNSVVDIGYHYVAVDANGNTIDSNGDGIPDWLSDSNGNGQVDSGEIGWNLVGDLGLKVLITRPKSNSPIP